MSEDSLRLIKYRLVIPYLTKSKRLRDLSLRIFRRYLSAIKSSTRMIIIRLLILHQIIARGYTPHRRRIKADAMRPFIRRRMLLLPTRITNSLLRVKMRMITRINNDGVRNIRNAGRKDLMIRNLAHMKSRRNKSARHIIKSRRKQHKIPHKMTADLRNIACTPQKRQTNIKLLLRRRLTERLLSRPTLIIILSRNIILLYHTLNRQLRPIYMIHRTVLINPLLSAFHCDINSESIRLYAVISRISRLIMSIYKRVLMRLASYRSILTRMLQKSLSEDSRLRHFLLYYFFRDARSWGTRIVVICGVAWSDILVMIVVLSSVTQNTTSPPRDPRSYQEL